MVLSVIKIVDEILGTRPDFEVRLFVDEFGKYLNLVLSTMDLFPRDFFALNIVHDDDFSFSIDGDENLNSLAVDRITRVRRRKSDDEMNTI